METTEGIKHRKNLKVGIPELNFLQFLQADQLRRLAFAGLGSLPALLIPRLPGGGLDTPFLVVGSAGAITITSTATARDSSDYGYFLTADGDVVRYTSGDAVNTSAAFISSITLTDDSTWRTVLVRAVTTEYGPGTIAVSTGSPNIVGTGTRFTEHAGNTTDGFDRGTKIRIAAGDTSNGNAGTYELDTVTDDTTAVLTGNVAGTTESGLRYTFAGSYLGSSPADPDCYTRLVLEFSVVARTREPPAGYAVLADVKRTGSAVSVVDRRTQSVHRLVQERPTVPRFLARPVRNGSGETEMLREFTELDTATYLGVHDVAACDDGGLLLLISSATDNLQTMRWVPKTGWAAAVNVTTGATNLGTGATIVRLPTGTGWTHRVCYLDNAVIQTRTTSDNGSTWSSATTIWTPASADASDTVAGQGELVLLRNHRLVYADRYHDESLDSDNSHYAIHFIWSDDYGATWSTNGNAGTQLLVYAGTHYARPVIGQLPDGRIWTLAFEVTATGDELFFVVSADHTTPTPNDAAADLDFIDGLSVSGYVDVALDVGPGGVLTLWSRDTLPSLTTTGERFVQLRPTSADGLEVLNTEHGWLVHNGTSSPTGLAGIRTPAGDWRMIHGQDPAAADAEINETTYAIIEQPIPEVAGAAF